MSVSTVFPDRSGDVLEAVIADARRRARRRRLRNVAVGSVALTLAATLATYQRVRGSQPTAARVSSPVAPGAPRSGALTILAGSTTEPTQGWYGISRIGTDGQLHPIVRCPGRSKWCGEPESIAWSPRGDRLALSVTSFAFPNPYNGLHVIDMRTRRDTQVRSCNVPAGECDWFDLAWAPDGATIAYVSSGNIILVDADGSHRRPLVAPRGRKSSPAWSPNGHAIAFADEIDGVSSIYRVDGDGSHLKLLTRHATAPAWSRSGTIAYHTDCGVQLMTGNGVPIVPTTARSCGAIGPPHLAAPVWSPDGRRIAATLSRRRPDRSRGTFVMNADGTGAVRVTSATLSVFIGNRPRIAWRPSR
jgi:hypothetical protein